ncbi:MAG TPA: DUF4254 domain-containing protein [Nannocystaceae bacterium]|nr:DUF4254 domain-containing protein [Nannocystaceae bacterium]
MAETVGSLIDKLTIVELRRWHTEEAMLNPQASVTVRHTAALRLHVIDEQRSDLTAELDQLWKDIIAGTKRPKIYRQMKLYNDAAMREASTGEAPASHTRVLAFPRSKP